MKAEHRKELQTNTLADMLGRTVRKVRTTSAIPWVKVLVVVVVVGGVGLFLWLRHNKARTNSELWADIDAGTIPSLVKLVDDNYKDTTQSKVARYQLAFELMWNQGIKMLAYSPMTAQTGILKGLVQYEALAKECKDDPVLEPEALYSVAVGTESLAVYDEKALDEALKNYNDLAKHDKYGGGKTAYGIQAQKRAAQLSDPVQRQEILAFYREFSTRTKAARPEDLIPKGK
jgi:hypothetical protein